MTPQAIQRTPLKENSCPDPGTIMQGKSFYIKDQSFHIQKLLPVSSIAKEIQFITEKLKNGDRKLEIPYPGFTSGSFRKYSLIEDPAFKQAFSVAGIKWSMLGLSVHAFCDIWYKFNTFSDFFLNNVEKGSGNRLICKNLNLLRFL